MRKGLRTWMAAVALVPAVTLLGGSSGVAAVRPALFNVQCNAAPQAQAQATRTTSPAAQAKSSTITLATGERVQYARGSGQPVVLPATGKGGSPAFTRFDWNGDQYLVPSEAVPYLGSLLDPRLFDLSYLERAKLDDAHTAALPVSVTYAAGPAGTALPGLRTSKAAGGAASATLAKSGATALGTLLATDWRTTHAGHALPTGDPLRGIARISLAQGAGSTLPSAPPSSAMQTTATTTGTAPKYRTLNINVIGTDGKPGAAIGWVQNLDDPRFSVLDMPSDSSWSWAGQQSPIALSVPVGDYSITLSVVTPHPNATFPVDATLLSLPQVKISGDTTVTLDARKATRYQATVSPSVSTQYRDDQIWLSRTAAGQSCANRFGLGLWSESTQGMEASTLMAAGTSKVSEGSDYFAADTDLFPGSVLQPSSASRYFLVFTDPDGVPANVSYTVPRASLTTVRENVSDPALPGGCAAGDRTGGFLMPQVYTHGGSTLDLEFEPIGGGVPSGEHTDYWYASQPEQTRWQNRFYSICDGPQSADRAYLQIKPGEQLNQDWGRFPLAPTPVAVPDHVTSVLPGTGPFPELRNLAVAARQGEFAFLNLGIGESDPGHFNAIYGAMGSQPNDSSFGSVLRFYRDGQVVTSSDPLGSPDDWRSWIYPTGVSLPILARPANYQLQWQLFPWPGSSSVSAISTDWTFRSAAAGDGQVPASLECGPDATQSCSFLPLLFLTYDLPLNSESRAKADGPFQVNFTIAHQEGEVAPSGVTATVSASFDGGKTWTAAVPATARGGGKFGTSIDVPALAATNGYVALRVHASDGSGNSVTQTITQSIGLTS